MAKTSMKVKQQRPQKYKVRVNKKTGAEVDSKKKK